MKDKINLTNNERVIINKFLIMKCPPVYKTDNTDRILFIELMEFDVCQYLLGKKQINNKQFSYINNEYKRYLTQTDSSTFDEYTKEHFMIIVKLMDIFKKHWQI